MSTPQPDDTGQVVAEAFVAIEVLARALHVKDAELQPTLDAIIAHAAMAHPAARDAGLILLASGKLVPQATTGRAPQLLDAKQQELGDGPCIEAARKQTVIVISDTGDDTRWPEFSAEAQACEVFSLLCAPLWASDRCLGALTLYSQRPAAFSQHDVQLIELFAALAALALAGAQRTSQLREALTTRDLIGQAKGILMERYKINADTAFSTLNRTSQSLNMKLIAIARHLTQTGQLPDLPASPPGSPPARCPSDTP